MLYLYASILIADLLAILAVIISVVSPENRIWPPPGNGTWQWWLFVAVDTVTSIGTPILGLLDRGSLGRGSPTLLGVGTTLIVLGGSLVAWAVRTLSLHQSYGLRGELVTQGPYSLSRNPQYVGFTILYSGIILVTDSYYALITGLAFILLVLLTPFSEEPWLEEQYGEEYIAYKERVPRFIGIPTNNRENVTQTGA
jgi:protein-S-isoprenylcysteine O-methyltransferase Ste14